MSSSVQISEFSFTEDFPSVLALWENAGDGIRLRDSDRSDEIKKKIQRDPDLFLVARIEDAIVGTVMGGFDGRRGFIYHLAVAEAFRHNGIARQLMDEVENRLKKKGCLKCYLLVTPDNQSAMDFYDKLGYEKMPVIPFGKRLT